MKKKKIWAGRIKKDASLLAEKFTSSIQVDKNLYTQDLAGTAAYVIGLEDIGIITKKELADILSAMKIVKEKIESQKVDFKDYEDIHSLIEFELEKLIGNAAGKIHTGRSRNDQIVVDELLFMKKAISETIKKIILLQKAIVSMAEENFGYVFPAYTHMQKAQPVLVSHYLLSYFEKFSRSLSKLFLNFENCDFLPLGAGACTGSGYALNRKLLASVLKFGKLASNSMDIVSSREHIVDFIYTCTMIMQNLSRFAEDLIIYNTREFSYINIDDAFCTGSSIMPQKKNPDILELVRGKSAIVTGNLMQILTLIKGLPLTKLTLLLIYLRSLSQ
jgi:argininosuccinate lyase